MGIVNFHLLSYELKQAGLPVECVDMNGRIDYSRELTAQEQATAAAVIAAHDPNGLLPEEQDARDYREARQAALQLLTNGIDAWAGMTATQKNAWVGANMDAVLRIIRALIRITT